MHAAPAGEVGLGDEPSCAPGTTVPRSSGATTMPMVPGAITSAGSERRVDAVDGQDLGEAVRRAGALGREDDPEPVVAQAPQPRAQAVGVADHGVEAGGGEQRRVGPLGRGKRVGRAGRACARGAGRTGATRRGSVVRRERPRWTRAPGERGLFVEQLLRAVTHAARLAQQHERVRVEQVGQQVLAVREPRQPRLQAVERRAFGEALPLRGAPGSARRVGGAGRAPHRSGAARARGRPTAVGSWVERWSATEKPTAGRLIAPEVDRARDGRRWRFVLKQSLRAAIWMNI